jgi:large subunit ribosomal protein L29
MKAKDMREKSLEDLRELEKSLAHDAFQAKFKNFTNRLDDSSQIQKLRRDVARVKTLLGEMQRAKDSDVSISSAPQQEVSAKTKSPTKTKAVKTGARSAKAAQSEATK